MTAGKTARQAYDSISFEPRLLVIYEETFYFLIYLDVFMWSCKTFQRIKFVQPDQHHSSGLLKIKFYSVSGFLIASRRHGAYFISDKDWRDFAAQYFKYVRCFSSSKQDEHHRMFI